MKYDQQVPKTFYFDNIDRFEQLKDEILRNDWSERAQDVSKPPVSVGGMHHLKMTISESPTDKDYFRITFRITDEPAYKETHPDLERIGRFFNKLFPDLR